ncbi:unnamed protein product [Trichobilharzia regenti]|nr:unnamed protein product [Trichobilharzia regenti]
MIVEVHELDKINGRNDHAPAVQLKKTIGLASSVTIIVGSMIGSGIFVSPTGILENVQSIGASLIIWVACGIFIVVARPASVAILAMTFAKYIAQPIFPTCDQPEIAVRLLATICIVLLSFVNAFSVRLSTFVQDIFTYAKLAALVMIIITGLVQIGFGKFKQLFSIED